MLRECEWAVLSLIYEAMKMLTPSISRVLAKAAKQLWNIEERAHNRDGSIGVSPRVHVC